MADEGEKSKSKPMRIWSDSDFREVCASMVSRMSGEKDRLVLRVSKTGAQQAFETPIKIMVELHSNGKVVDSQGGVLRETFARGNMDDILLSKNNFQQLIKNGGAHTELRVEAERPLAKMELRMAEIKQGKGGPRWYEQSELEALSGIAKEMAGRGMYSAQLTDYNTGKEVEIPLPTARRTKGRR